MANAVMTREEQTTHTIELKDSQIRTMADGMVIFRIPPVKLTRWTRLRVNLNLPGNPKHLFVQTYYGANQTLDKSDNFSTVVAQCKQNVIELNIWRTDNSADPAYLYGFDVLAVV